ncbi:hypothetical protein FT643_18290 [Ketobacter sp. MCCC 1A13808]|uniref:LPP20 family lipoprotein n=1 Tax=Ketobacter sp. MCCC 1A13808 TaxID=2602738 RepID=UPI0012EC89BF|nr:LPP20 family lipoprotein [Ketobacter sp. MCCC 1A13808]MVF14090.1 hypothetical protein [Ketobacter sp. MCCC 1A13808]
MALRIHLNAAVALVLLSVLAACSSAPKQPEWIDKPDAEYPAHTHLAAIGSADNRPLAADRAVSNLSKIFEVAVAESSLDFSSAQLSSTGGQQVSSNEQKVTRSVSTEAKQVMSGAQVVEYWESEEDARIYALAILAKQPAANRFRKSITTSDREINELVNYATSKAGNPLVALKALKKAHGLQLERDQLNKNLMVVASGQGVDGRYDLPAIEKLIRDGLSTLKIAVKADDPSVKAELQKAISDLGITTAQQSNLVLQGTLDTAPVEARQNWYWLRGSYELIFFDGSNVLDKQRWPIKVSSTEQNLLKQRARDEINRNLPQYVFDMLSSAPN